MRSVRVVAAAVLSLLAVSSVALAVEKQGGILRGYHRDSPASASIHEEATYSVNVPFMPVFNNPAIYKQDVAQNSMDSIVPDLAESWAWSGDNKTLNFKLRQGVKWHDGKPFTSADVKCTWDMLIGKAPNKLRLNPRKAWYRNLDDVATDGDYAVTFILKRSQPAFISLLAGGMAPVYPCHVPPAQMRLHPIGTGPFKFVEFKQNEHIKVAKNPDYWKPGRPYLDGIEWTVVPNRATQSLAFIAGQFDMTFPYEVTIAMAKDIKGQVPNAICDIDPTMIAFNLMVNRDNPPFNDPDIRKAM